VTIVSTCLKLSASDMPSDYPPYFNLPGGTNVEQATFTSAIDGHDITNVLAQFEDKPVPAVTSYTKFEELHIGPLLECPLHSTGNRVFT